MTTPPGARLVGMMLAVGTSTKTLRSPPSAFPLASRLTVRPSASSSIRAARGGLAPFEIQRARLSNAIAQMSVWRNADDVAPAGQSQVKLPANAEIGLSGSLLICDIAATSYSR